jgi:hypothetical protein
LGLLPVGNLNLKLADRTPTAPEPLQAAARFRPVRKSVPALSSDSGPISVRLLRGVGKFPSTRRGNIGSTTQASITPTYQSPASFAVARMRG